MSRIDDALADCGSPVATNIADAQFARRPPRSLLLRAASSVVADRSASNNQSHHPRWLSDYRTMGVAVTQVDTAVEFSIVLVPFLLMIFAIVEGGWLFHDYAELKNGVSEGARRASVANADHPVRDRARRSRRPRIGARGAASDVVAARHHRVQYCRGIGSKRDRCVTRLCAPGGRRRNRPPW